MMKALSSLWVVIVFLLIVPSASSDPGLIQSLPAPDAPLPFQPGERLTYEISWSHIITAGTAVMEVTESMAPDGKPLYHLVSTAHSSRLLSKFYAVSDKIVSVFDVEGRRPLSYSLDQSHGKRKKAREMAFDYSAGVVTVLSDGTRNGYAIPADIQDPLSSLYFVRMHRDFTVGKPIIVNVHDDDKNWSVEVQVLGKEKLKTAIGEIETIKLRTYPRYEGVFQNKGEIFLWLSDDARKIPVLMKSTISIGSIVSTLVEAKFGKEGK